MLMEWSKILGLLSRFASLKGLGDRPGFSYIRYAPSLNEPRFPSDLTCGLTDLNANSLGVDFRWRQGYEWPCRRRDSARSIEHISEAVKLVFRRFVGSTC